MGLLDALFPTSAGGGLLDFLRRNANMAVADTPVGAPGDQANYGSPFVPQAISAAPLPPIPSGTISVNQPSRLDSARWPYGPIGAPSSAMAQMPGPAPASVAPAMPAAPSATNFLGTRPYRISDALASISRGGSLLGAVKGQYDDPQSIAGQTGNLTARALIARGVDPQTAMAAVQPGNAELLKQLFSAPKYQNIGEGHIIDQNGKVIQAYEPEDKTPPSVLEYQYYLKGLKPGETPMDYATFSTQKARAGATSVTTNVDTKPSQTYSNTMAAAIAKSHGALANGVEDAQARARDIAAMQGAIDTIQKNGGTTGGMGQQQIVNLQKTINAGLSAFGVEKPFSEADISDKEFLTKFNRQMAGAQAKGAVGARVTNFELENFLKSNPGLDMSLTGNQRLLGIQAQIEQRNIAVGNAIRDATTQAMAKHQDVDPATVQKIITDYDNTHHIRDPITGQDLTQNYALPEFQNANPANAGMAADHAKNVQRIQKTIGGKHYWTDDGGKTWNEN